MSLISLVLKDLTVLIPYGDCWYFGVRFLFVAIAFLRLRKNAIAFLFFVDRFSDEIAIKHRLIFITYNSH